MLLFYCLNSILFQQFFTITEILLTQCESRCPTLKENSFSNLYDFHPLSAALFIDIENRLKQKGSIYTMNV